MKKIILDKEEQKIMNAIEAGDYSPVPNAAEENMLARLAAKNTLKKSRAISIRITERDYINIKAKAAKEGIPYQTYIGSLLHKATA